MVRSVVPGTRAEAFSGPSLSARRVSHNFISYVPIIMWHTL
jgi:hypothetical protein